MKIEQLTKIAISKKTHRKLKLWCIKNNTKMLDAVEDFIGVRVTKKKTVFNTK